MKSVLKKPRNFQSRIINRACTKKLPLESAGMASTNGDLRGTEFMSDTNSSIINRKLQDTVGEDTKPVCRTLENGSTEFPFGLEDLQVCRDDGREMRQLKELLLLHLDLIQKQQEMLMVKDREIRTLKSEKNALRCRLERMERRMSLLRQKGVHQPMSPVTSARSEPRLANNEENRGIKRRLSLEPQNLSKKFNSVGTPQHNSSSHWNVGGRSQDQASDTDSLSRVRGARSKYNTDSSKVQSGRDTPPQHRRRPYRKGHRTGQKPSSKAAKLQNGNAAKDDQSILRTDVMYYVPPIDPEEESRPEKPIHHPDIVKSELEVPCWRIRVYPRAYQIEGTEDLDDNLFSRRHARLEHEEKRRKRWDAQRIREQQVIENLKCGRGSNSGKSSEEDSKSSCFRQRVEKVKYIEVCDQVPVMGFGYPIPSIKPSEFELPWFDAEKREKREQRKSTCESRRR